MEGVHSGPWLGARRRLQAGPRRPRCPSGGAAAHPEHWPDSGQNNNNIVSAISTISSEFHPQHSLKRKVSKLQWRLFSESLAPPHLLLDVHHVHEALGSGREAGAHLLHQGLDPLHVNAGAQAQAQAWAGFTVCMRRGTLGL